MRFQKTALLSAVLLAAACAPQDNNSPTEPQFAVVPEKGKPQDVACRPADLKAVENGKIKKNDCLFVNGQGVEQRENLFRVDQLALGLPDLSGANMLTFTPDAEFSGIFGVSNWDETRFGVPVYGYNNFVANSTDRTFSIIGSNPEYKLFISGADATQLGKYTLTTTVAASSNSCTSGSRTFLQGNVAFSSTIDDGNSCDGTIAVGPYAGGPLKYQFWYAKLKAGQTVTVSIDGVDTNDPTITLAAIVFGSPFARLDFADSAGNDPDRSLTFTAPFEAYYYIEVSGAPGVSSSYDFSFTSN